MSNSTSYPYKMNRGFSWTAFFFFGICCGWMASIAHYNESELTIHSLLHLTVAEATQFYGVISFLFFILMLSFLWIIRREAEFKRAILLTHDSISAPQTRFSNKSIMIPYHEISTVFVEQIGGYPLLKIFSHDQKLIIPQYLLSKESFDQLLVDLANRIKLAQKEADY